MKKNILIICSNMNIGGFQTSLIALLKCFDYDSYNVDLLLLEKNGVFTDQIPKQVHILEEILPHEYFQSVGSATRCMLKGGRLSLAGIRLLAGIYSKYDKGKAAKLLSVPMPEIKKHYDAAIDYNGQHILYYLVDKIHADKKISYFHSDYKMWPYYEKMDRRYYAKVDAIVTVSDQCVDSMKEIFPEYREKIYKIENIIAPKTVGRGIIQPAELDDKIGIVTVARVCQEKGIDFAIEACELLKRDGYDFKWYWVGPYGSNDACLQEIRIRGLDDVLILTGGTNNPYPYMAACQIMVLPSRFEGKSVTIEEGKVWNIPIIATRYSTVQDQIDDRKTGLIVDMNAHAVADGIKELIDDTELREHIIRTQQKICLGNEEEAEKLYRLIEG